MSWTFVWRAADGSRTIRQGGLTESNARSMVNREMKSHPSNGWYRDGDDVWYSRYGDSMWLEKS